VDGNWVEFDLELYDFLEGLRESDLNDGLLIATRNLRSSVRVIVSDGPLLEEVSLLIDHILVKLTVLMRQRIIPLRSENVSTFRISEAFTGFSWSVRSGKSRIALLISLFFYCMALYFLRFIPKVCSMP
jgi:hypothetical protein